jgi:hypothetical protein
LHSAQFIFGLGQPKAAIRSISRFTVQQCVSDASRNFSHFFAAELSVGAEYGESVLALGSVWLIVLLFAVHQFGRN